MTHLLPGVQLSDELRQKALPASREVMGGDDGQGLADLRSHAGRRVQHEVDDETLDLLLQEAADVCSPEAGPGCFCLPATFHIFYQHAVRYSW